jgi:hypothetical protein
MDVRSLLCLSSREQAADREECGDCHDQSNDHRRSQRQQDSDTMLDNQFEPLHNADAGRNKLSVVR